MGDFHPHVICQIQASSLSQYPVPDDVHLQRGMVVAIEGKWPVKDHPPTIQGTKRDHHDPDGRIDNHNCLELSVEKSLGGIWNRGILRITMAILACRGGHGR